MTETVVDRLLAASDVRDHPLRVAVDATLSAEPASFAAEVRDGLRRLGRVAELIPAESFWRDASLRLEYGHTDVESYFDGWLDRPALERAVLAPLGPGGSLRYLPALRDPATNRSSHRAEIEVPPHSVVIVAGDLLLGRGLSFDLSVHIAVSDAARRRRTPEARQWTLPAVDRYEREIDPTAQADIVITWNDPARPALRTD